jgi:hypothetical protein
MALQGMKEVYSGRNRQSQGVLIWEVDRMVKPDEYSL